MTLKANPGLTWITRIQHIKEILAHWSFLWHCSQMTKSSNQLGWSKTGESIKSGVWIHNSKLYHFEENGWIKTIAVHKLSCFHKNILHLLFSGITVTQIVYGYIKVKMRSKGDMREERHTKG